MTAFTGTYADLNVKLAGQSYTVTWIDPKTGKRTSSVDTAKDKITLRAPSSGDWAAIIKVEPKTK